MASLRNDKSAAALRQEAASVKYDLYTPAETITTRIFPELAAEIGLNESIVLLQIAHWIRISKHDVEGQWWAFKSIRDMKADDFPYFSIATINRTIKALVDKQFIVVRDDLNTRKGDKTRWFALNIDGLSRLLSVVVLTAEAQKSASPAQIETASAQFETPSAQDETTLPEITTENKDKESVAPKKARRADLIYDAISTTWKTTASGFIVTLKSIMLGTSKRKGISDSNFDTPVTDAQEILDFGAWWRKTFPRMTLPNTPTLVQKHFYDFRTSKRARAETSSPDRLAKQAAYEEWLHAQVVHDPKWDRSGIVGVTQ